MGLGRKAVFLSFSAILIVGVLFVVFAPTSQRDLETGSRLHAQEIVSQVNSLETNELDVWLEYVSRSALNILAQEAADGRYISREEFNQEFRECILFAPGSACRNADVFVAPTELLTRLEEFYDNELGHEDVSIELVDIAIGELGAQSVIVQGTFEIQLSNSANRLSVDRTVQREVVFSLEGLLDPIALRHGIDDQRFEFVNVIVWDLQNLFRHAEHGTYVYTNEDYPGVLYFDRFAQELEVSYNQTVHFLLPPSGATPRESHIGFQRLLDTDDQPGCLLQLRDTAVGAAESYLYIDPLFTTLYGIYDPYSDAYNEQYRVGFEGEGGNCG